MHWETLDLSEAEMTDIPADRLSNPKGHRDLCAVSQPTATTSRHSKCGHFQLMEKVQGSGALLHSSICRSISGDELGD